MQTQDDLARGVDVDLAFGRGGLNARDGCGKASEGGSDVDGTNQAGDDVAGVAAVRTLEGFGARGGRICARRTEVQDSLGLSREGIARCGEVEEGLAVFGGDGVGASASKDSSILPNASVEMTQLCMPASNE